MVNLRVNVVERDSQQFVEGVIRPVREDDKVLWSHWHGALEAGAEDGHWAWDDLMDQAFADPDQFVVYALEAFGELQGLRMIQISQNEVEEYGIHALRLSTAPWNRPPMVRYRGVGSLLVAIAILRSQADARDGHIHCESLPGAEEFHRKNGMMFFAGRRLRGWHATASRARPRTAF